MQIRSQSTLLVICTAIACKSYLGQALDPSGSKQGIPMYTIGGTVSGLTGTLILQNNGGDDLVVNANGVFKFAKSLPDGAFYDVTVLSNPANQVCHVSNNQGNVAGTDVTNIIVQCATDSVWVQDAYLKASNAQVGDWFGIPVAISGSTIVVGAYMELPM